MAMGIRMGMGRKVGSEEKGNWRGGSIPEKNFVSFDPFVVNLGK